MGAFLFLIPQLFQLPLVHEKTSAFLARQIPGEVTYEKETLSLFPVPRIHFYDVHLIIDGRFSATVDEVSASPHFLSLLRGRFNISKLTLAGVNAAAPISEQTRAVMPEMILATLEKQLETWADMLGPVKQKKFVLDITDGTLSLTRGEKPVFSLQDLDGKLTWRFPILSLDVTTRTDLWDRGRLTLDTDIAALKISGRLAVDGLVPGPVCNLVFPDAPLRLEDAALDADIAWEIDEPDTWRLSVEAFDPNLTFNNGETRFNLRGKKAAAEIRRDKTGFQASISELDLDTPGLCLTGEFKLNTETPSAFWQADVDTLDIASTKAAALFFSGRFETVQNIARIFQDGGISRLTMGQEADTLDELRKVSTFYLRGQLDDATIYVPEPDLLLNDSYGNVSVSWGILTASDLKTRLGSATGSRGSFTMALTGEKPRPWSVSCNVQADLAQLPPLLERLTEGTALAHEMAGIESAEGSVEGTLKLDHSSDDLRVTVDASKFDLSANYHRIPFPVTLSGDRFFYQGSRLQVQGVRGNIGASRLSDLDAGITWEAPPRLNISSARGEVDTDELASWLGGIFTECRDQEDAATDSGRLHVQHLQMDGPVHEPSAWQLQTDGYMKTPITVCTPLFPEALTVYQGSFAATQNRIDIDDADLSVLGSRLSGAGSLEGFLTEAPRILNLSLNGSLGREATEWIYHRAGIPEILRWRTPVSVNSLALRWHETDGVSISGEAAVPNGPRLSLAIAKSADVLTVNRLDILDSDNRATISMTRNRDGITARFSGDLYRDTVSAILADNQVLSGSLQGDISAQFDASAPFFGSMIGRLQANGLDLGPFGLPLKISHASLSGNGTSVEIENTVFTWNGIEFSPAGHAARSKESIMLDLTLDAGQLDWSDVKTLMDTMASGETSSAPLMLGDVQFTCKRLSLTPLLSFEPFGAQLKLGKNRTDIEFQQADACGISFPGALTLMPDHVLFAFKPVATQQDLAHTAACLKEGNAFMDGSFDLTGDIAFEWDRSGSLMEAVEGNASLTAMDGRIYKGGFLGKLFSMLNVSEIMSGQFPDFEKEGFSYKTATFEGKFITGKFELETGVIDGPAMKLFFEGAEDFIKKQHALTIVVAPLKTVDAMVDKIPLLNDVLEKGLVVYPVKVTGGWEDPQLALLSPTAVGGEVLGIMLRTLKAPVKLFEKILPRGNTDQEKTTP